MERPVLVVLDDHEGEIAAAPAMQRLRSLAHVILLDHSPRPEDMCLLARAQVILAVRERTRIDAAFLAACPRLELLLQTGGHAYHIDLDAAGARGIPVALGRRVSTPARVIPELVFTLLLALVRRLEPTLQAMRAGQWPSVLGGSLHGRRLGILGHGRLGRPVARLAQAFGMEVFAWDRLGSQPVPDEYGVRFLPLDELLSHCDVITIHLRLSPESRALIGAEQLALMKPGALLINISRGAIVDQDALVDALSSGRLGGAGLDVFDTEPLSPTSPLRSMEQVLLTPHCGWMARDLFHEFVHIAADQLHAWLGAGLPAEELANPSLPGASPVYRRATNPDPHTGADS
ncbi:MAG: D-2-hydroxyacid dehydrogenase family protein [Candidatus Delongbacteria bacterium]|nr:D-2-hydroxyacid dehydrogenase family protein [Candidatus Delongbacteria bacterium]